MSGVGVDLKYAVGVGLALVSLAPFLSDEIRTLAGLLGFAILFVSACAWVLRKTTASGALGSGPKVAIYLSESDGGVRTVPTLVRTSPPRDGPLSKWVQFTVAGTSDLVDCEPWLVSVTRLLDDGTTKAVSSSQSVLCTWGLPLPGEETKTNVRAGMPRPANIFSMYENDPTLHVEVRPKSIGFIKEMQQPGRYLLQVGVTAKDVPLRTERFLFDWESFDKISIGPAPE